MMRTQTIVWWVATYAVGLASPAVGQSPTWLSELASLDSKPAALAGTLVVPNGVAKAPLAIIIAGSGPTDRDGNGPMVRPNNLKQLAEARFGAIVIIGHSEGSLLGMLATQRAPADGFVSVAGTGRRANRVLHDQLAAQLPPPLLAQADSVLDALVAGKTVDNSPPMLAALFRPSVQPYIISWFKYAGSVEIARLRVPTLIVQGTNDIQVAPAEADSLKLGLPSAQLLVIAGMNHVMKSTPPGRAEQMFAYSDPNVPLTDGLADSVAAFVKRVRK